MTVKEFKEIVANSTDHMAILLEDESGVRTQCGFYDKSNHIELGTIYDGCTIKSVAAHTEDGFEVVIDKGAEYRVRFAIEERFPFSHDTVFVFGKDADENEITEAINDAFFKWVEEFCDNIRNYAYSASELVK